jgi:two-component system, NarL family, sensor kinase
MRFNPFNQPKSQVLLSPRFRWGLIIVVFLLISALDFSTPPEYVLAYLYVIPILVSVSFLKPKISKWLLLMAVVATLSNLLLPSTMWPLSSILVNRLLAVLSMIISTIFMVSYIRHQAQVQEQETLFETERNLGKMREDFIATLTHDLKTPLLGEQTIFQHFLDGTLGPINSDHRETLEALNRSKHRQLELVDNLLSVYRHDNLGVELRIQPVDMDGLIADLLTEIQPLASERKLHVDYFCRRLPPPVKGDALQLKRVIANLLHNALNYTPSGGRIEVSVIEDDSHLVVGVADNGPGLPETELENVFHRFYRAEGTRDTVGTGLGLYLSRQLIQAHRGKIWAENRTEGGCRFCFTLPFASDSNF